MVFLDLELKSWPWNMMGMVLCPRFKGSERYQHKTLEGEEEEKERKKDEKDKDKES